MLRLSTAGALVSIPIGCHSSWKPIFSAATWRSSP